MHRWRGVSASLNLHRNIWRSTTLRYLMLTGASGDSQSRLFQSRRSIDESRGERKYLVMVVGLGSGSGALLLCDGTIADVVLNFPGHCVVRSWNALELEPLNRADA